MAIPCNISHQHLPSALFNSSVTSFPSSSTSSDGLNLILWYRGEDISGSPIYTVDGRDISSKGTGTGTWSNSGGGSATNNNDSSRHFVGSELTNRAHVNLAMHPATLIIDSIDSGDSGTYWCRVDFRWTRTLISMVQLTVHGTV